MYCVGRKALKIDYPVKNISLCTKRTTESLEADDVLISSSSAVKESPKKSRNAKKALVYKLDDEFSDNESIFVNAEQKAEPKNIDSSNCEICEEKTQDIHDTLPSTSSTSNYDEKENDSHLQEASSSNVDLAKPRNSMPWRVFCSSPPCIHTDRLFTRDPMLILKQLCREELIEVSPRKKCPEMAAKSISNIDLDLLLSRVSNPRTDKRHAFENERPITPEKYIFK